MRGFIGSIMNRVRTRLIAPTMVASDCQIFPSVTNNPRRLTGLRAWWNGRHTGLKILRGYPRAGSSPAARTRCLETSAGLSFSTSRQATDAERRHGSCPRPDQRLDGYRRRAIPSDHVDVTKRRPAIGVAETRCKAAFAPRACAPNLVVEEAKAASHDLDFPHAHRAAALSGWTITSGRLSASTLVPGRPHASQLPAQHFVGAA
ncbi:MAG: hypothetical protein JWP26_2836 [Devosia sp.]|nr:hypothetical protein [Devosia sp.]